MKYYITIKELDKDIFSKIYWTFHSGTYFNVGDCISCVLNVDIDSEAQEYPNLKIQANAAPVLEKNYHFVEPINAKYEQIEENGLIKMKEDIETELDLGISLAHCKGWVAYEGKAIKCDLRYLNEPNWVSIRTLADDLKQKIEES